MDRGFALENAVFLSLRTVGIHPDYVITSAGTGVDFVYRDGDAWHFVQCCWSLGEVVTLAVIRGRVSARKRIARWNARAPRTNAAPDG